MLMLTGGGESCADIEQLRIQEQLFGDVCSDSTVHRTFHQVTPAILADLTVRFATVRQRMWAQLPAVAGDGMIVLDIDASLVQIHSEKKEETGATYKGGFGFHPLLNEYWQPALRATRDIAERSHVAELSSLVDLSDMPAGTRLIVRRERLHAGAQRSLFPCTLYRYWGHYTDNPDLTPVEADAHMRAHAHVEDHIKRLKESGLERFPFTKIGANRAWLQTVCMAADMVRWFQLLCCAGPLINAQPKRMRWTFWHAPARVIRQARQHIIRIIDGWPTTSDIITAHQRLTLLC
jgi:Transposase DDE domain group 1